jgi:probable rRNA maturation factor
LAWNNNYHALLSDQYLYVVTIIFCTDNEIRDLNKTYRNKDNPTDVLTFSYWEEQGVPEDVMFPSIADKTTDELPLGDIIISLETAFKQSKKYDTTYGEEIVRLLIHGLHHLYGYDHENVSQAEARKMRSSEKKIFAAFREYAPLLTL